MLRSIAASVRLAEGNKEPLLVSHDRLGVEYARRAIAVQGPWVVVDVRAGATWPVFVPEPVGESADHVLAGS